MKPPRNIGKEPSLSKVVLISVILHILFISFVVVPVTTKPRDRRIYSVRLVTPIKKTRKAPVKKTWRSTVRKKRVLPKKKVAPKDTVKTVPEEKAVASEPPRPKADITLEEIEMAATEIERLRAIKNLAKKIEKEKREKKVAAIKKIRIRRERIPARPEPAEDTAVSEEAAGEEVGSDDGLISYHDLIIQEVEQRWVYPGRDISGLETIISISIADNGEIIIQEIIKSSGDMLYDRSAIKAINSASPLPPPPEGFDTDIEMSF